MPEDPAGQLLWYGLRDLNDHHHVRHRQDLEDARKHRTKKRVEVVFGKLAGIDPLYAGTVRVMDHYYRNQLGSGRRALHEMFEQGPEEALDFYREMRRAAELASGIYHSRRVRRIGREA